MSSRPDPLRGVKRDASSDGSLTNEVGRDLGELGQALQILWPGSRAMTIANRLAVYHRCGQMPSFGNSIEGLGRIGPMPR